MDITIKKVALICLALSLAACGGDTYFNEPEADVSACIVGTWEPKGIVPDYIYSEQMTYFSDGTYRYETITETSATDSFLEGVGMWLFFGDEWQDDTFDRFKVTRTTGGWEYHDGFFFAAYTDTHQVTGATVEEALGNVPWELLAPGVPISDIAPGTRKISGSTVHCDEEFMDTKTLHTVSEDPLTYQFEVRGAYPGDPEYTYLTRNSEKFVLFDDGSATYSIIEENYPYGLFDEVVHDAEYVYDGNLIDVSYSICDTCSKNQTRHIVDRATTVTYGDSYLQRVQ